MSLTETQIKALRILKVVPLRPREFAKRMWPESNMHRKVSNQGNGACAGKAAWLCGGSYLSKLRKLGFVKWDDGIYSITQKGIDVL